MHLETFDCFVIFDNWIKRFLLQFLPVLAQVVFGIGVEQEKEILNIRNNFLQSEIIASSIELEGFFLEFSH